MQRIIHSPEQLAEETWRLQQEKKDAKDAKTKKRLDSDEAQRRIKKCRGSWFGRQSDELDLSRLGLATLPPEICDLSALKTLRLSGNDLRAVPPEIGKLNALLTLDLSMNNLATLPPEIGKIKTLTKLDIRGNRLTSLPREIGELQALTSLDFSMNILTTTPWAICELKALIALDLSRNSLEMLAVEIGQLKALKILDLHQNNLTAIPPEIGQLRALTRLDLSKNRLTKLPSEIGQLEALTVLYLRANRLMTLPPEIGQLRALAEVSLHENTGLGLPPEVLGSGREDGNAIPASPDAIFDYYFSRGKAAAATGTRPLMEAKVLVLGQPRVGKSSLIAAITEGLLAQDFKKTDGIARKLWKTPVDRNATEKLGLNFWDFGGQEIYHAAHTIFLTARAVYAIVVNARDSDEQNKLDYWLRMAESFGGEDARIWVVFNYADDASPALPRHDLLRKYAPRLRGFLLTSCRDGRGIKEARATLVQAALNLPQTRQEFPNSWFAVKELLENLKTPTISLQDYAALCTENREPDPKGQRSLLDLCDKLGTVRFFSVNEDDAPEFGLTAIVNPEWVTLGIYALLDDAELRTQGGLMTEAQMQRALRAKGYAPEQHRIIEQVMRRYHMLYDSTDHGEQHRMVVPLLLTDKEPALGWPAQVELRFFYRYTVLPAGLLPTFIARRHRDLRAETKPWKNGCVLALTGCRARIVADDAEKLVEIEVTGEPFHCREALDKVRHSFEDIHAILRPEDVSEWIPVPGHPEADSINYKTLRNYEHNQRAILEVDGRAPGELIPVDVKQALAGVRGMSKAAEEPSAFIIHGDYIEGDKPMKNDHSIHIGGDVTNAQIGQTLTDCSIVIRQLPVGDRKKWLTDLHSDVQRLIELLPPEKQEEAPQVVENLELLVKQVMSVKPNRKWYEVSTQGLLEASKWVKDFSGNIAGTLAKLGTSLWPGFLLPDNDGGKKEV